MKKTLLFTFALFVAFATFGQATVLDATAGSIQVSVANTNFTQSFPSGTTTTGAAGSGSQINANDPTNLTGTISFDVVSSGADFDAEIRFHVRKLFGNSGSVDLTIDGTTDNFPLAKDASAANLDAFETFNTLNFSQTVTITSTPKTITLDVDIDKDAATSLARYRYYWVRFTNPALSVDDVELNKTSIVAYPNPVTNSFQINSNKNIESVKLYNITGRLLKTFNEEASYDISDLATGVYVANVKTASGSKAIRIVKK